MLGSSASKFMQAPSDMEVAQPSAPTWQCSASSALAPYPVIALAVPQNPSSERKPEASASQPRPERGASDWEPQTDEDWEGVEPPQHCPTRGASLMETQVPSRKPYSLGEELPKVRKACDSYRHGSTTLPGSIGYNMCGKGLYRAPAVQTCVAVPGNP